jgi:lyso-ornithine lipid O-acyltransferase
MTSWQDAPAPQVRLRVGDWIRVLWRGMLVGALTYGGLALLLLVRLVEWPIFGQARPLTPWITQFVCRNALRVLRLPLTVRGEPMARPGAIVANHSSWLDVFVLNAAQRVYFVAKSEVSGWPGIGWLARATGTLFIARKGIEAKKQQDLFEARLTEGHRLLFFPEGTSTDAVRVLPFKSSLFQAFYAPALVNRMHIQPSGPGRGDLSSRSAGFGLRGPQGPGAALRAGDPRRALERGPVGQVLGFLALLRAVPAPEGSAARQLDRQRPRFPRPPRRNR